MNQHLKLLTQIWGVSVGLASSIIMAYIFINEGFYHRGVLLIEPDVPLARLELVTVLVGIIFLFIFYLNIIERRPE
jgi:hypothetical protein